VVGWWVVVLGCLGGWGVGGLVRDKQIRTRLRSIEQARGTDCDTRTRGKDEKDGVHHMVGPKSRVA